MRFRRQHPFRSIKARVVNLFKYLRKVKCRLEDRYYGSVSED